MILYFFVLLIILFLLVNQPVKGVHWSERRLTFTSIDERFTMVESSFDVLILHSRRGDSIEKVRFANDKISRINILEDVRGSYAYTENDNLFPFTYEGVDVVIQTDNYSGGWAFSGSEIYSANIYQDEGQTGNLITLYLYDAFGP